MRSFRRIAFALLACGLLAPLASAQTRAAFDGIVDFSVTMKTVAAAAAGEATLPANRLVLLEGTFTEIVVLDDRPGHWTVRIELMAGEWIGVDEVRGYRCWVTFSGSAWADVFPADVPETPAPAYIPLHSLVLAGSPAPVTTPEGERVMSLKGLAIRATL
jgi:hypothetical protein